MNDQIARMAGMMGDNNGGKPPKYVVPLIRFDGNRGEFRKISFNEAGEKEETPLTNAKKKTVEIVILKKRRLLSSFSPNISYFTTEHNTINDVIQLFSNTAGVIKHEATGFTKELREKFQTLKTHEVIYALHDGEVCKFEVKGGSLGGYYDYQKKLQGENLHGFQVVTVLGSEAAKNEAQFKYFRVTFNNKELDISLDDVEAKMKEVDENIKKIDDYFRARQASMKPDLNKAAEAQAERDYAALGEPNPDDIPF